jgi:uncharacterized protein YgiM (DUF1202 family)
MTYDPIAWPHCAHGEAVVMGDKLNVRETPSLNGRVAGQMLTGTTVTVWAVVGDWMLIQDQAGLTGYSARRYLAVVGELIP